MEMVMLLAARALFADHKFRNGRSTSRGSDMMLVISGVHMAAVAAAALVLVSLPRSDAHNERRRAGVFMCVLCVCASKICLWKICAPDYGHEYSTLCILLYTMSACEAHCESEI